MRIVRHMCWIAGVVLIVASCSESSSTSSDGIFSSSGGGWGQSSTVKGTHGEKLVLYRPGNVSLKRGDAEKVTVRLKRENFSEDVKISVSQLPAGVEAVDAPRTTSSDSIEVVLRATDGADLVKNHRVMITAEGPEGIRTTETFKVTVRDRS